ncbi:hypothetical protein KGQ31_02860 [Patescibacteria group bacterium]|nr:hypothetical protein [Patescibacteria group bacterium]
MEDFTPQHATKLEKKIVLPEETAKTARTLLEKYAEDIRLAEAEPQDPEARFGSENAIRNYLRKVPTEILSKYSVHGITKGDTLDQLNALLNVCENSVISGDTGKLTGAAYGAYTHGSALVCSEPDKELFLPRDAERKTGTFRNLRGAEKEYSEVKIGLIILGVKWYPIHKELKKLFPEINFIQANQIPEYFIEH